MPAGLGLRAVLGYALGARPMLLRLHPPDREIAFGADGPRTAADLLRDAAAVCTSLPAAFEGSSILMVFRNDRYAFTAGLLGAWAAGHAVALPPNQRGETIQAMLERPDVTALLHDTDAGGHLRVPDLWANPRTVPLDRPRVPPGIVATVFTSGSTGDVEPWRKTADQLLGEVDVLCHTLGLGDGERTVATVGPSHLYGLLWSVLLPLVSGGSFLRETPLLPEAISDKIARFGARTLVTVPVHLRLHDAMRPGSLRSLARVVSSTAPLESDVARSFHTGHGLEVTEVFGSTETGGIAWRLRPGDASWTPLPSVRIEADGDGRLRVRSPFADPSADGSHLTRDLVDIHPDGTFVHRGRMDGIVKVGGRRVSLPAMEECLRARPDVHDVAIVAVPVPGRGARILAAVVGREVTESELRATLSDRFDRSSLPRRFVFVDRLPRESNGKLQRRQMLALFGLDANGRTMATRLEHDPEADRREGSATIHATLRVPEDYAWFRGHFETYPVMAGVVQLHEVLAPLIRRHRPDLGPTTAVRRVKFLGRILPGDELDVSLTFGDDRCDFRIAKGPTVCSAGQLRFDPNRSSS